MKNWDQILVGPTVPILDVIKILDRFAAQIVLVVDSDRRLLGTITDGDIRRGILRGLVLDEPATAIMNPKPLTALPSSSPQERLALIRSRRLRHLPVVDAGGVLVGLETESELLAGEELPNWVILMVGGLGERLRPLTATTPKPLLPVGGRPLLETILLQLAASGFRRVFLAVNYMAEKFEEAFGDGSRLGLDIRYLREDGKLGTAGALGLLPEMPSGPVVVMNGDVLTSVNYRALLDFHAEQAAAATMCVREYDIEVPYGVVEVENSRVRGLKEKPVLTHFINAGIYVLDPVVLGHLETGQPCDMPGLLTKMMAQERPVVAFPIREYWLDIGRLDDFAKANGDYDHVFRGTDG
ncbi:D-glycero-D-manno-heptose 1-phosphate guanosyltransferase [Paramagnetospirillum magnetotacticum MS-1]|uniref:D-glycero-D-manno-heptose 1-phosphate guanosyltransferase n=1 Tax=Paramagnetospirillum magnetotacticum MS-1 TaxID=272627 RepID=A0A0C2YSU6_PARME|nr:nucleotidyltransferase family protein [Paramagnetospirillum magnetotacticum]KIL97795.1 D-glycero-D-manno-heptose 1-phosphate guanosyltransferase [Paramagnetospirillum magnetotacticum MS-1]